MQSISQKLQDDIRKIMDVTNATNEAKKLVGGQVKLDKNHNGKLDGQDFKMIRGQKPGMKEDTDSQIQELAGKAAQQAAIAISLIKAGKKDGKMPKPMKEEIKKVVSPFDYKNRPSELPKKPGELTGHESKKTSTGTVYTKKPVKEEANKESKKDFQDRQQRLATAGAETAKDPARLKRLSNIPGYSAAMDLAKKTTKEEVENLDELSKGTLNSYMDKAKGRLIKHMSSTSPSNPDAARKSVNLATNMLKAKNKGGNYTEEFSFSDYLVAAIHIVGEDHAVELANYAFNLQDTSIFENLETEAFNASNVNATHAADVKAHHTAELKKKADAGDENAKKRMELIKKSREAKTAEFNSRMDYM